MLNQIQHAASDRAKQYYFLFVFFLFDSAEPLTFFVVGDVRGSLNALEAVFAILLLVRTEFFLVAIIISSF